MNRIPLVAALFALALVPATALADSPSPSPSPSLDTVLAPAPSGYAELTTAALHGEFSAHDWAVNGTGASPTETERTLNNLGFVDGYGKEWSSSSLRRGLIEAVMAFGGGRGAENMLAALKKTDTTDPHYTQADTISGIDTYYGGHFATGSVFEDEFVFVKGNDLFIVIAAGAEDSVLTVAQDQATAQFQSAPAQTIPSAQWPENQSNGAADAIGRLVEFVLVGLFIAGVLGVVIGVRRRKPPAMAVGTYAPPPMSAVQMSPDGNFWWDGQTWKDVTQGAPPSAQRSTDGSLWWDGSNWRPVPGATQATPPPAG